MLTRFSIKSIERWGQQISFTTNTFEHSSVQPCPAWCSPVPHSTHLYKYVNFCWSELQVCVRPLQHRMLFYNKNWVDSTKIIIKRKLWMFDSQLASLATHNKHWNHLSTLDGVEFCYWLIKIIAIDFVFFDSLPITLLWTRIVKHHLTTTQYFVTIGLTPTKKRPERIHFRTFEVILALSVRPPLFLAGAHDNFQKN